VINKISGLWIGPRVKKNRRDEENIRVEKRKDAIEDEIYGKFRGFRR
jgi:hypothetical protein